jgi:hypothetical protein
MAVLIADAPYRNNIMPKCASMPTPTSMQPTYGVVQLGFLTTCSTVRHARAPHGRMAVAVRLKPRTAAL